MEKDDRVLLWGSHRSVRVTCDDDACSLRHWEDGQAGVGKDGAATRYHYEDGPRESVKATYEGKEGRRLVLRLADGTQVTADKGDVTDG